MHPDEAEEGVAKDVSHDEHLLEAMMVDTTPC